jgi:hypothetical protein
MPNCRDIEIIDSFSVGAIQKLIKSISTDAIGWVLFLNFRFQHVPVKGDCPVILTLWNFCCTVYSAFKFRFESHL